MLAISNSWAPYVVASALTISMLSIFIWNGKKRNYVKVGKISKLLFYPVKSLKAIEVTEGKCTKLGFEVNGLLDRSFLVINKDGVLVSLKEAPTFAFLTPRFSENYLIISGPNTDDLKVEIKKSPSPGDKRIDCCLWDDSAKGIDCGDEAASWFQSYLKMEGVRLVRFFPTEAAKKYTRNNAFIAQIKEKYPAGFQNLSAFHVLSQASIDDLNSRLDERGVTVSNFKPNILVGGCNAFAEDSWKYMKFNSGAELLNLALTTRCMLTTYDPDMSKLSQKEPLVTLRKYRIPADKKIRKSTGSKPCLGTSCAVLAPGEIHVDDEILATIEDVPKMEVKEL